jgi:hypothetical protein
MMLRVGERGADAHRHDRDRRERDQMGATEELHSVPPVRGMSLARHVLPQV